MGSVRWVRWVLVGDSGAPQGMGLELLVGWPTPLAVGLTQEL